jgi:hypothetical protein
MTISHIDSENFFEKIDKVKNNKKNILDLEIDNIKNIGKIVNKLLEFKILLNIIKY